MVPADLNSPVRRNDWRRFIFWTGLIFFVVALPVVWLAGPSLLRSAARVWVVSDRIDQADVIAVLGGGLDVRPRAAAELYRRGIAPKVAVGVSQFDGGRDAQRNREMLMRYGVPWSAIVNFKVEFHSTYGEALGILEWAKTSGAQSVVIPTDIFPTRRTRWIFNRVLAPARIGTTVEAITPPRYNVDNWWQHQAGWKVFKNELIKFAYYRLRY